jgi:methylated-DNA-[protein]-cysteine S-methyltransferase
MYIRHAIVETQLGAITIVAADNAVTGLYFPHHWYKPAAESFGEQVELSTDALLSLAAVEVNEYLASSRTSFNVPTKTFGDPFQEQTWALLKDIPFGETRTYGELAEQIGDKSLAQAVGKAVGLNPLCVIVPCHRVVGKNGRLAGYAGGNTRKQFLLDLEKRAAAQGGKSF